MNNDDLLSPVDDTPIFMGSYDRGLDAKGRITLPASFREALGAEGAVLTRGLDRSLFLFPKQYFLELRQRLRALSITQDEERRLKRLIFSGAAPIKPDGQGRVNIPPPLRHHAELDGSVTVIGNDSYIEIWSAENWTDQLRQFEESADQAEAWNNIIF